VTRVAKEGPIRHKFVEFIPKEIDDRILYVSIQYCTAVHKCFCGCGQKVVTPLSPAQWRLIFDGETASLEPSIGNWSFRCESHYWITNSQVKAAEHLAQESIAAIRAADHQSLEGRAEQKAAKITTPQATRPRNFLDRLKSWLTRD
jgi:Family of unknown function (DUF6527)